MSQQACEAEGLLALIAGTETSASVMRVTMLCLMSSPVIYHKFKVMIQEAVKAGLVSTPITGSEAKKLPYLQVMYRASAEECSRILKTSCRLLSMKGSALERLLPDYTLRASPSLGKYSWGISSRQEPQSG